MQVQPGMGRTNNWISCFEEFNEAINCTNDHDEEDKNEKCLMDKHYYDFSKGVKDNNNDDGRFDC